MLFQRRFHAGLTDGSITLTFRLWSRPQVRVGGRYGCPPIGLLEVDAIDRIRADRVRQADARRAGFPDRDALIGYLERQSKKTVRGDTSLYRVRLHFAGPDLRPSPGLDADLTDAEIETLVARLDRMDAAGRDGPWTRRTLGLIDRQPRVAASRLAVRLGRETQPLKIDVRKLKKLGLTLSHEVGYEISLRGRTFLARTRARRARGSSP